MRLIDADELKKTICNYEFDSPDKRIKHGGDIVLNLYIPKVIDDIPTIEAEHERHGKWINALEHCGAFVCSDCEYQSTALYKYCPNCGAKMDGGTDNSKADEYE